MRVQPPGHVVRDGDIAGDKRMTTREKLDYRDRAELDEKLDYRDENTEGREEHQTEHPNSSYQAANQHMVKFNDELKAINEQTSLDFEFRKNPAERSLTPVLVDALDTCLADTLRHGQKDRGHGYGGSANRHPVGLPFRWVNVMDIARRKSAINPCSWPPNGIGLVAARLTSGDHLRRYIEYPEDLRVAAGPFLQERSSMARALAPASVIAGRVLGFGSPHLKQGAVSWATM